MSSKIDIINLALYKLAQSVVIPSLSDQSKAADIMRRLYDPMRDLVLEARVWPFALVCKKLALSAEPVQPGWKYRYARPNDCVTIRAVTDEAGLRNVRVLATFAEPEFVRWGAGNWVYQYEEAYGAEGTSINTDTELAYVVYVCRVEDEGRFSASFVNAFATRLAAEAAPPILGEVGLNAKKDLMNEYGFAVTDAGAHSYAQGNDNTTQTGAAEAARG